jgi:hypothetical protein
MRFENHAFQSSRSNQSNSISRTHLGQVPPNAEPLNANPDVRRPALSVAAVARYHIRRSPSGAKTSIRLKLNLPWGIKY